MEATSSSANFVDLDALRAAVAERIRIRPTGSSENSENKEIEAAPSGSASATPGLEDGATRQEEMAEPLEEVTDSPVFEESTDPIDTRSLPPTVREESTAFAHSPLEMPDSTGDLPVAAHPSSDEDEPSNGAGVPTASEVAEIRAMTILAFSEAPRNLEEPEACLADSGSVAAAPDLPQTVVDSLQPAKPEVATVPPFAAAAESRELPADASTSPQEARLAPASPEPLKVQEEGGSAHAGTSGSSILPEVSEGCEPVLNLGKETGLCPTPPEETALPDTTETTEALIAETIDSSTVLPIAPDGSTPSDDATDTSATRRQLVSSTVISAASEIPRDEDSPSDPMRLSLTEEPSLSPDEDGASTTLRNTDELREDLDGASGSMCSAAAKVDHAESQEPSPELSEEPGFSLADGVEMPYLETDETQEPAICSLEAMLAPPSWPGTHRWRLASAALSVQHCDACGSSWLQPSSCCGQPLREAPAPYYVACRSPFLVASPEFSVIMLTKNNLALTRTAVESLRRARGDHSVEFIFVDNGSTDGSLNYFHELARQEAIHLIVTHPDEPFVYARNANRGAEVACGKFFLFANNDIEVRDSELFAKLARGLNDPRVGAIGTLTDYDCGNELQRQASLPAERIWSAKPVMGFLWGVRAEVFAELSGLDEGFRDYGCDEIDFQYRAVHRNYRLAVVDSPVHHAVHATFGSNVIPGLIRNIEYFNAKHGCQLVDGGEWYAPFLSHSYPRVSIAIACRDDGPFLARSLDSVLGGYLPAGIGRQVVVVNDASTDQTNGILEQYRLRYPDQVNAIHRSRSHGPAVAKNQAIARCIGEYIALLDADDEFLEYKLWRCLETLDTTAADFLYHDFAFVHPDGRHQRSSLGGWLLERWQAGETFSIPPSTWMFRSGSVRFCERYVTGEDPEFLRRQWNRLSTTYLPEMLSRYYVHSDSLSQRAMCRVVTGQLRGTPFADVGGCSDVPVLPAR